MKGKTVGKVAKSVAKPAAPKHAAKPVSKAGAPKHAAKAAVRRAKPLAAPAVPIDQDAPQPTDNYVDMPPQSIIDQEQQFDGNY